MITTSPISSKQPARNGQAKQRTFRIFFVIEGQLYAVNPVSVHQDLGRKAFRFLKLNAYDPAEYYILLDVQGRPSCECPGFLSHGRCKHVRTLKAARMLD